MTNDSSFYKMRLNYIVILLWKCHKYIQGKLEKNRILCNSISVIQIKR